MRIAASTWMSISSFSSSGKLARPAAAGGSRHRGPRPAPALGVPRRTRMQQDRAQEALEARDQVTALDAGMGRERGGWPRFFSFRSRSTRRVPRGRTGIRPHGRCVSRPRSARSLPARSSNILASDRRCSRARTEAPVIQSTTSAATNRAATTPTCTPIGTRDPNRVSDIAEPWTCPGGLYHQDRHLLQDPCRVPLGTPHRRRDGPLDRARWAETSPARRGFCAHAHRPGSSQAASWPGSSSA